MYGRLQRWLDYKVEGEDAHRCVDNAAAEESFRYRSGSLHCPISDHLRRQTSAAGRARFRILCCGVASRA